MSFGADGAIDKFPQDSHAQESGNLILERKVVEDLESLNLQEFWRQLEGASRLGVFGYGRLFFSYVVGGIRRNIVGTVAIVLLTALAVFMCGTLLLATKPLAEILFAEDLRIPVKVYLTQSEDEAASQEQVGSLLAGFPEVEKVEFVSGTIALKNLREKLGSDHPLFEGLDPLRQAASSVRDKSDATAVASKNFQPLPSRFLVTVGAGFSKIEVFEKLKNELATVAAVEKVRYQSEIVQQLQRLSLLFSRIGSLFAIGAFASAVLIVIVAMHLRFLLRAREVGVMKLVGATHSFMVFPLYFEALLSVLVAVIIGLVFLWWAEARLYEEVSTLLPRLEYRTDLFSLSYMTKAGLGLAALLTALFGTWFSVSLFQRER
ncbi:MAG: cell division protein FtsX [Bdellovibrionota bacterium]